MTKKPVAKPSTRPAHKRRPEAADAEVISVSAEGDPEAQAQEIVKLIDSVGEDSPVEARKLRNGLVALIDEYRMAREKGGDLEAIRKVMMAQVIQLERFGADVALKSTTKLRNRLRDETRRLGTKGPMAQTVRRAAEGVELMVEAIETMKKSTQNGDSKLRDKAYEMIAKARELIGA